MMPSKTEIIFPDQINQIPISKIVPDDWFVLKGVVYRCIVNQLVDGRWKQFFINFDRLPTARTIHPKTLVKKYDCTLNLTEPKSS